MSSYDFMFFLGVVCSLLLRIKKNGCFDWWIPFVAWLDSSNGMQWTGLLSFAWVPTRTTTTRWLRGKNPEWCQSRRHNHLPSKCGSLLWCVSVSTSAAVFIHLFVIFYQEYNWRKTWFGYLFGVRMQQKPTTDAYGERSCAWRRRTRQGTHPPMP
jgi:hypothetical protein